MAGNQFPVLVVGATGTQGGAVAEALLRHGQTVRVLVRDPDAAPARRLAERGAELAVGDFEDQASIARATSGASGLFSMQNVGGPNDEDLEMRTGRTLIAAARAAGIDTIVHSSVARAGDHAAFVGWDEGRWWVRYWVDKAEMNALVRSAGFRRHVILKPAYMMDNFLSPKADFMTPQLGEGRLVTALDRDTRLDLVAARDIGEFAAAAFAEPDRFHGAEIDLAGQSLTMGEMARVLSDVTGRPVRAEHLNEQDALAAGLLKMVIDGHLWDNVEGYRVDIPALAQWGVSLTSFAAWARDHASDLVVG